MAHHKVVEVHWMNQEKTSIFAQNVPIHCFDKFLCVCTYVCRQYMQSKVLLISSSLGIEWNYGNYASHD